MISDDTGIDLGVVRFWVDELFQKHTIIQTRYDSFAEESHFKIRPGQATLLRRIGTIR